MTTNMTLEILPPLTMDELPDWHDLSDEEKEHEWEWGNHSRYAHHPQFDKQFCVGCGGFVFPDEDDACPSNPGAWDHYFQYDTD